MKKRVIITGSTGMVGKGVLLECLDNNKIDRVLLINRSQIGLTHPKLTEVILKDFTQFDSTKDQLNGYDACFHCMGVSVAGLSEEVYTKLTFQVTKSLADTLFDLNPNMIMTYISGMGTDSNEKARAMWKRVKGKTENYILAKGFKKSLMFRPGFVVPEKGIRSKTKLYQFFYTLLNPFMGLIKKSKNVTTTTKIGQAMIAAFDSSLPKIYYENADINLLAGELS